MTRALLLTVRLHEPRYHGVGDWPPSPMRLFQALVAGVAEGAHLGEEDSIALRWLESLPPPEIVAPPTVIGDAYTNYVPSNDADSVLSKPSADYPAQVQRNEKKIQPRLVIGDGPLHYLWPMAGDAAEADRVCIVAERLHHLGRGVDAAWCDAAVMSETDARSTVGEDGIHYLPSGGGSHRLATATPGSLDSLNRRFSLSRQKFQKFGGKRTYTQPPKPVFREVAYNAPPYRVLYDIRDGTAFAPVPAAKAGPLIIGLLRRAAERISDSLPGSTEKAQRFILGKDATAADKPRRIRLIPLPSIMSDHVDRSIRRVLLEVPQDCPIRRDDLAWAFDGIDAWDADGVTFGSLVKAGDHKMQRHYEAAAQTWQTETPAVLGAVRRRLGPDDTKSGTDRSGEEAAAIASVLQALRHAGIHEHADQIEVRREPFAARGTRVDDFQIPDRADGSARFSKHALWHVRIRFARRQPGPLMIGNGRFAGLGLLSPVRADSDILVFRICAGLTPNAEPEAVAAALRRAVMARVQANMGRRMLPGWFTGHAWDGAPDQTGKHNHLAFVVDLPRQRLMIVAPSRFDPRTNPSRDHMGRLQEAMEEFSALRAGSAGILKLAPDFVDHTDPLLAPSRYWHSLTPFAATRHPRRESVEDALISDAARELGRRGLPTAKVDVLEVLARDGPPRARLALTFATAQAGPILLGRTLHKGGGVFQPGRPEG